MIWIFDIECYPNFFSAIFKNYKTKEIKKYIIHESRNDIQELVQFISNPHLWLAGYNNFNYDNQLLKWLWSTNREIQSESWSANEITKELHRISTWIIEEDYRDHMFRLPYKSLDLMKIGNLGQKSLKLVGTVMKWPKLQDLPIAPDQEIKSEEIEELLLYNLNDVEITEKLLSLLEPAINLRFNVAKEYKVDVHSETDSGMANRLLEKFYSEATGLDKKDFKKLRTKRGRVSMMDVIMQDVSFQTDTMMQFLEDLRKVVWYESVPFLKKSIILHGTKYVTGMGGLNVWPCEK